jgi:molecular chaperone DnaK
MGMIFGLDFGTTNSLVALVQGDRVIHFLDGNEPHPSVVWYRSGEITVVGRVAKENLGSRQSGVIGDFVRSPKFNLGKGHPVYVAGRNLAASDVVSEILAFLRNDVMRKDRGLKDISFERAVVTIPVTMHGPARQELREAAHKAGLRIHQFVHEPLAALYGHLRAHPDFRRRIAELENKVALVFDWGGGTLDLTLCKFMRGSLVQIGNRGDTEVGGDRFDEAIADWVREKHRTQHSLPSGREDTELAKARLIEQCELAKKQLSIQNSTFIFVRDFIQRSGPEHTLQIAITTDDLLAVSDRLLAQGLENIDNLLSSAGYDQRSLAFCLATGGMCRVPFIQRRLQEKFGFDRVEAPEHAEWLIADGAAWIAQDGLPLELAKPFELYHADNTYVPIMYEKRRLPIENVQEPPVSLQVYCVDPRDGFAKLQFGRPTLPGRTSPSDPRQIYTTQTLKVDASAPPFVERIMLDLVIDHNLVVSVRARSGEDDTLTEIHDLEFGLHVGPASDAGSPDGHGGSSSGGKPSATEIERTPGAVRIRSNVLLQSDEADGHHRWDLVPGDIIDKYSPRYSPFVLNERQIGEKMYYVPCALCHQGIYEIMLHGCNEPKCPESRRSSATSRSVTH